MVFAQSRGELVDGIIRGDVKLGILDVCQARVLRQSLGLLEGRIGEQSLDCRLTAALVASSEIDEQRPVVETRLGVLQSELAD